VSRTDPSGKHEPARWGRGGTAVAAAAIALSGWWEGDGSDCMSDQLQHMGEWKGQACQLPWHEPGRVGMHTLNARALHD
jgi:hypothetical protein